MSHIQSNRGRKRLRAAIIASLAVSIFCLGQWSMGGVGGGGGTLLATSALAQAKEHDAPHAATLADASETTATAGIGTEAADEAQTADNSGDEAAESNLRAVFATDPMASLNGAMQKRKDELDKREKALREREAGLNALNKEVEAKLARIDATYDAMQRSANAATEQRQAEIGKWVKIYESMKAGEAAGVFTTMDQELALQVLLKMEPKKAAKILDQMVIGLAADSNSRARAQELGNALSATKH